MKFSIDLNCDLGESYFTRKIGDDAAIIPYISSCNIACGLHGGDPLTIQKAIDLALKNGVNIGAHPSFPDLANFGRKYMKLSEEELKACLRVQIGMLKQMTELRGGELRHIKPHGALYNAAAEDKELSRIIVEVINEFDSDLLLLGLAGSKMETVSKEMGLKFVPELFADRGYTDKGKLVSRQQPNAVIENPDEVSKRCVKMVQERTVITNLNTNLIVEGKSICVHGDTPNALGLVQSIHKAFELGQIEIKKF